MFDFAFFLISISVMLVHISAIYVDNISHFGLSVSFCVGLLDEKPGFEPQARHQNDIFLSRFPLS